jgi:hypothetical protein
MKNQSEKYETIISLLRKSKPVLDSTDEIERVVLKRIKIVHRSGLYLSELVDLLFGWVYIGWVRRSLIAASAALVLVFVYQQGVILKRIDVLSKQTVIIDKEKTTTPDTEIEKLLMTYKNAGRKFPFNTVTLSERQMDELLESIKELQIKYKDLEDLIEGDPELKKLIEQKLIESNRNKINL